MRRLGRTLAILALLASGATGAATPDGAAGDCSPQALDACRYGPTSQQRFATVPDQIVELEYADITGTMRRFSIPVRRPLHWLEEQAAGPSKGRIDPRRLLYAGHSAGAGATLMVAGASRDFAGKLRTLSDPRPVAFIGCSALAFADAYLRDEPGARSYLASEKLRVLSGGAFELFLRSTTSSRTKEVAP